MRPPVKHHPLCIALLLTLPLFTAATSKAADNPPPGAKAVQAGKQLAEQHCARCHNIYNEGESPLPAAPNFTSFNEKWPLGYLEEALAEGIVTGHTDMPEFQFEPEEIDSILAYIEALKQS